MTVPGLGAVGSGGRGVPGSVEKRKINELEQAEETNQPQTPHTQTGHGMQWVGRWMKYPLCLASFP